MFAGVPIVYHMAQIVFQNNGIKGIVHERGGLDDTFTFRENESMVGVKNTVRLFNRNFRDTPLCDNKLKWVKNHLEERKQGVNTNFIKYTNNENSIDVRKVLNLKQNKKVFALMLSSEHENSQYKGEIDQLFDSQLDGIQYLIELFKNRKDYLIIKSHPAIHVDTEFFTYLLKIDQSCSILTILMNSNFGQL